MKTEVRSPLDIFNLPQHLVIPLFQRPYVWSQENQWVPLWDDIRRLSELRLREPSTNATHFFGAVVLQAQENQTGTFQPRLIIDGQQRLTTLQLLMDATASVLESRDEDNLARRLEELTHNPAHYVEHEHDRLKLRHTNRDRAAFDEVMQADQPVDYKSLDQTQSLLVQGHEFFFTAVEGWLGPTTDTEAHLRAEALTGVLTRGLQLVVIDLQADENSQEIFETLNARGTPLTAADLIKNFVFQRLDAEGSDTSSAYKNDWPFDSAFWEREVSAGRYLITRSSLFLNQWLVSRTGEEISPRATFTRFKHFAEHESPHSMTNLLPIIKKQAVLYQRWTERAADPHAPLTSVELNVYRLQSSELEVLKPVLIWLHEPGSDHEQSVIDGVVNACESWVMRRVLTRLGTSDLGRVVADLIDSNRHTPSANLVLAVRTYLTRLNAASTYWPGDKAVIEEVKTQPVYRRFKRGRLRVFLEAIEDQQRGFTDTKPLSNGRVPRVGYPIEHLMPQKWEANWPVDGPLEQEERREHIHRLGNLTLLTQALNGKVSNGPWLGDGGKRAKLDNHDVFLLNRRIRDVSHNGWTEALIDERTVTLIDSLLETWPVPDGHKGEVKDKPSEPSASITLKQLVSAGLLVPGTELQSRSGNWQNLPATVTDDANLSLDGKIFTTPSGAGHHLRQGSTNGWHFWLLPDGRRLSDLRDEYLSARRENTSDDAANSVSVGQQNSPTPSEPLSQ